MVQNNNKVCETAIAQFCSTCCFYFLLFTSSFARWLSKSRTHNTLISCMCVLLFFFLWWASNECIDPSSSYYYVYVRMDIYIYILCALYFMQLQRRVLSDRRDWNIYSIFSFRFHKSGRLMFYLKKPIDVEFFCFRQ